MDQIMREKYYGKSSISSMFSQFTPSNHLFFHQKKPRYAAFFDLY